jgi:hypothetical protein
VFGDFLKSPNTKVTKQEDNSITNIEINLEPAFNNSSIIFIDKVSNTIQYKVDTTIKWRAEIPTTFSTSLDSFRANTLVDSFYSETFLNSIKSKPGNVVRDGLSIFTVAKKGNISDTIYSGNVYPEILTTNIISQIDYISKNTLNKPLKKYIKDLRSYF